MPDARENPFQSPAASETPVSVLSPLALASPLLSLPSLFLSFCLLTWIGAQPTDTFHDQGGLLITLFLFPFALAGWLLFGLPAMVVGIVGLVRLRQGQRTVSRIVVPVSGILLGGIGALLALVVLIAA
jgi:hypothetical protein